MTPHAPQRLTQFRVTIPNLPGELAKVTHLLLKSKVNITGMMTECLGDVSYIRMLATPERVATDVLEDAGFDVMEVPVFQVDLPNKPGRLDSLARELGESKVNILCIYGTGNGDSARLVIGVEEPDRAAEIIDRWAQHETRAKHHSVRH
jgi:hypothetical protein